MRSPLQRGFTLLELIIAMMLLALMSSLLYGTLSLSAGSWDKGEAKAVQSSDMRLTEEFLRQSLTAQHPLRMHKVFDQPLYFQGSRDTLAYAGVLPGRAGGGIYYFQLSVTRATDAPSLVLARLLPDAAATTLPVFDAAEKSSLANGIAEVRFSYFGRDADSNVAVAPTWRQEWRDPNVLPVMIRIDVIPEKGSAWPSLVVEPRLAPEVGCRSWDLNRNRCIGL
ncbi:MAG: prepilin-type N-terminal cleavage/methylation domain-containing protein [Betaproteobacteria bacterium]